MYSKKLTTLLNDEEKYLELKRYFGSDPKIPVNGERFSQFEMKCAFELIEDKKHWKNPIDATIDESDFELCDYACIFFTGGCLEVVENKDGKLRVQSPGYFEIIGA